MPGNDGSAYRYWPGQSPAPSASAESCGCIWSGMSMARIVHTAVAVGARARRGGRNPAGLAGGDPVQQPDSQADDLISKVTDAVNEEFAAWQNWPLDRICPVEARSGGRPCPAPTSSPTAPVMPAP